ncbi:MAG TPA: thiamine ABC transporter substrate-binding protein [Rectinemataceae bacterium]|nr:thiamine ABC transporter substrate-binding protein [Rectinemataceae bacterium]
MAAEDNILVVYTYDSFVADWGPAPKIAPLFEKATGIKLRFVSKGDGGQLLASLLLERGHPQADIALGLDNFLAPKALASGLFASYAPAGLDALPASLKIDPSNRLIPFDYGHFAIIWDSQKLEQPPRSLDDLTKPQYAKKLILMDPRTSTPGLGFLAWTEAAFGPAWKDYWKRLRPSVLAMTPGWDEGYGLFTNGEAPLVLSYTTSPAYHKEVDKTERYKALEFSDGHIAEIEVAGILAGAAHPSNARTFMDFLISLQCQNELPLTQWMYPVNPAVRLPTSYDLALRPSRILSVDPARPVADAVEAAEILSGGK